MRFLLDVTLACALAGGVIGLVGMIQLKAFENITQSEKFIAIATALFAASFGMIIILYLGTILASLEVQEIACPNCGTEVSIDYTYCPECGYDMETVCPECGGETQEADVFCPWCGAEL